MEKAKNKENRITETLINSFELQLEKVENLSKKINKLEEELND